MDRIIGAGLDADQKMQIAVPWQENLPAQVSRILRSALSVQATDVHIDPVSNSTYRICFRVDGVIHPQEKLSMDQGHHLINQIKVASQFTPDRIFSALEGRIPLSADEEQREVRVTVVPTTRSEAAHLRIMTPPSEVLRPTQLGLTEEAIGLIQQTLRRPEGLILMTGSTGAGKTMTLYALARFLELERMIAVSVEDPVEFDLPFVRQIQADPDNGFSMADSLKTVLRMDPDMIMIGEVRDEQSAVAAVRAGASGRFVLATMHATDPSLAIEACHYYSVPRHLLGSSVRLIISQALVRRICSKCAKERAPTSEEKEMYLAEDLAVPDRVPVAEGCQDCHGFGYLGRIGVFQVVAIDQALSHIISQPNGGQAFREKLKEREYASLRKDALGKVASGITTMDEVRDMHFPGDSEWM
jgi:type II secretory ATPase GspE/PulE/Tfp pilus assembly ATPase PilB-like protein